MKEWYILKAISGKELIVKRNLQRKLFSQGLQDLLGEVLVPSQEVIEIKKTGKKKKTRKRFFPGYIFVQIEMTMDVLLLVKTINFSLGFISEKTGIPIPVPDAEIKLALAKTVECGSTVKSKISFLLGETVRVIDGPFAEQNGVVNDVNYEKNRICISILIFGRHTPVELELDQVEKI